MGNILGPFIGCVTATTAKIWLQNTSAPIQNGEVTVFVSLYRKDLEPKTLKVSKLTVSSATLYTGIASFDDLLPNTVYNYSIWLDDLLTQPMDLEGLTSADLFFSTLPIDETVDRLDFILMSCHNPIISNSDGSNGCAVWKQIPSIIKENGTVRFAIFGGDQVYADAIDGTEPKLLNESDPQKRQAIYLDIYREHWSDINYRKVLCSIPAIMMWDDHDITDGWGSRQESFPPREDEFLPNWKAMFDTAKTAFQFMQASRNPPPLSPNYGKGFDTAFLVGRTGFVLADLRSNRNLKKHQIWAAEQFDNVVRWVDQFRDHIDTLFFVSTVVFSHDPNAVDDVIESSWADVMKLIEHFANNKWLKDSVSKFNRNVGDLRDDVDDSWGSKVNARDCDKVLDFLFGLQNPSDGRNRINVVILSGDIHTPGYSCVYSSDPAHSKRAIIPHIVSSPVAYEASSWILEAIFRDMSTTVTLGERGMYTAQVSHHFCKRNVTVLSMRPIDAGQTQLLKVKYYLEGFPEPQILLFDLTNSSHREALTWNRQA